MSPADPAGDTLRDEPARWPVEGTEDLHRDDWVVALRADRVRRPDDPEGSSFRRIVLEHPGAVVVLALDEDDRVFCLRQYRHAAGARLVELPAGLCDQEGEEPLAVAQRELLEEAHLAATDWEHLSTVYSSPGISDEVVHTYLARGLTAATAEGFSPEHEEADMEPLWVPFADLHRAAVQGRLQDTPLVLAVLMAAARGSVPGSPSGAASGE